ncbi:discoidin domain-containing protein [Arthrobacter sp. NPDC090010]|uniref:discoidin domain-containing protein n=1 Tax=Arthrobacter sp. NPDC090010 TaxID=3363942 RepID=UPI003822FFEE
MSQQIEVGSVLGGRYKVTGSVLMSHDQDQVLDGVDQVLNRPVSILVASEQNAERLSLSAREVATGERPGAMQILDLGVTEGLTYLITSHSNAPDLLDLLVETNAPYVEPFFTETLGSEIFGEARSSEPETYGGRYEDDGSVIHYDSPEPEDESPEPAEPQQAEPAAPQPAPPARQAVPPAAPATEPVQRTPDVTPSREPSAPVVDPEPAAATAAFAQAPSEDEQRREASHFPAAARGEMLGFDTEPEEETEPIAENRSTRWIVGGVLVVVLIAALIFAVNSLGSIFSSGTPAATSSSSAPPSTAPSPSQQPQTSAPPVLPAPAIDSLTRLGTFDFAAEYDKDLTKAIDGNNATYWSNMEFATENWGGFVKSVPLVVKLKEAAPIKSVTLAQLGGSGGSVTVYTNDKPSLDGAKQVASNSFTGPNLSMTVTGNVTAQYVIVDITALPRLAAPRTQYPYGLRLSEIKIQ